ncbi:hypothetical protein [Streptomyces sp. NPDC001933]|uniref:hypothetical protein n=1 Tax=Streptomyces sp. NPDC001933 TaxID=3364626 RepID=UPI0036A265CE
MRVEEECPQRFRCCVCGGDTAGASDCIALEMAVEHLPTRQWFGAHAGCLNGVLAEGFGVELHLMQVGRPLDIMDHPDS